MKPLPPEALAIVGGYHADPFHYLGPHEENGQLVVRALLPHADEVAVVSSDKHVSQLVRLHDAGLFAGEVPHDVRHYTLKARWKDKVVALEDPYRFPPVLSDFDLYLLGEGTHLESYDKLGAHPMTRDDVKGVAFVVLAPNARRVSVVGDFNFWDGRRHAMRVRGNGYWEIFVPGATLGQRYKYEIVGPDGSLLPLKSDPYAFAAEVRPSTASVIADETKFVPQSPGPAGANRRNGPISIYEVHLGSWRRNPADANRWLSYRELAAELPAYVAGLGFTHVEFLPTSEHPFDGSWGYQPIGLYAPTSRFGSPADFLALVDACHEAGLAVLLDWVPGHFPDDPHGLAVLDGTALYEHA
jgi:1,4-alpha-glucan branching enzyme